MKVILGILSVFTVVSLVDINLPDASEEITWPTYYYDTVENPITPEKVYLGRVLFYDPILSADSTISCASCHSQYTAFTHVDHQLSHGIDDRIGTRNSPTLMNLGYHSTFMWDGAIHLLDAQALAPISHPDEMGETISHVVVKLNRIPAYRKLFFDAFGDSLVTGEHTLKALGSFMVSLESKNSKYDRVIAGVETFTEQEKNGYELFKQHCASCHKEPLFSVNEFVWNGLPIDTSLNDFGRMKITNLPEDSLKFKIPTLRNVEFSYPYMHDGRFGSLREVLDFYSYGIPYKLARVDERLHTPLEFNDHEKTDIIAFLLTLTDKEFLFNKDYSFPFDFFFPKAKDQ